MGIEIGGFKLCAGCSEGVRTRRGGQTVYIPKRRHINIQEVGQLRRTLSISEVAKRIGVTPRHVCRLMAAARGH